MINIPLVTLCWAGGVVSNWFMPCVLLAVCDHLLMVVFYVVRLFWHEFI